MLTLPPHPFTLQITNRPVVFGLVCALLISHLGVFGLLSWIPVCVLEWLVVVAFVVYYEVKSDKRHHAVLNFPDGYSEMVTYRDGETNEPIREQVVYRTLIVTPGMPTQEDAA